jgi:GINS complex subunit 2
LTRETSNPGFSQLPFRFAEISKVILDMLVGTLLGYEDDTETVDSASDDLENPDKIRTLLKDIREARQAKSREGITKLDHSELGVRCPPPLPTDFVSYTCQAFWSLFYGDQ